jgi:hypothetical protein
MKIVVRTILSFLIINFILDQCANPGTITGGPKDTIPPEFISANPFHQSLDVKDKTFTFEFTEPINADKLITELLITPTTENKFTSSIKKNTLVIKFEDEFLDSTTYTFNFRNGVGDATEKNPVPNFTYAFSTGPYIDSLSIRGTIVDLVTQAPQKDFLVGLYEIVDTLELNVNKPYYFYNSDESGQFQIENIKSGTFLLFAFKDENNNLIFNPKDEAFAVYSDTIFMSANATHDSVQLFCQKFNADPLTMISARPTGQHFILRYSKPVTDIKIYRDNTEDSQPLYYQLNDEHSELLFYNHPEIPLSETDSITIFINASDTLNTNLVDTVSIKYLTSNRKPKKLSLSASDIKFKNDTLSLFIKSSKPIYKIRKEYINLKIDTLLSISPDTLFINDQNEILGLYLVLIPFEGSKVYQSIRDTLLPDSTNFPDLMNLSLELKSSSIQSIELDTLEKPINVNLNLTKTVEKGIINFSLITDKPSFELHLINKKKQIVKRIKNQTDFVIDNLEPDTYSIIIYIDDNQNGIWEVANPIKNKTSESIYLYPQETELRANWIIDIVDISF